MSETHQEGGPKINQERSPKVIEQKKKETIERLTLNNLASDTQWFSYEKDKWIYHLYYTWKNSELEFASKENMNKFLLKIRWFIQESANLGEFKVDAENLNILNNWQVVLSPKEITGILWSITGGFVMDKIVAFLNFALKNPSDFKITDLNKALKKAKQEKTHTRKAKGKIKKLKNHIKSMDETENSLGKDMIREWIADPKE